MLATARPSCTYLRSFQVRPLFTLSLTNDVSSLCRAAHINHIYNLNKWPVQTTSKSRSGQVKKNGAVDKSDTTAVNTINAIRASKYSHTVSEMKIACEPLVPRLKTNLQN